MFVSRLSGNGLYDVTICCVPVRRDEQQEHAETF
jgi:hypothetical protein